MNMSTGAAVSEWFGSYIFLLFFCCLTTYRFNQKWDINIGTTNINVNLQKLIQFDWLQNEISAICSIFSKLLDQDFSITVDS